MAILDREAHCVGFTTWTARRHGDVCAVATASARVVVRDQRGSRNVSDPIVAVRLTPDLPPDGDVSEVSIPAAEGQVEGDGTWAFAAVAGGRFRVDGIARGSRIGWTRHLIVDRDGEYEVTLRDDSDH